MFLSFLSCLPVQQGRPPPPNHGRPGLQQPFQRSFSHQPTASSDRGQDELVLFGAQGHGGSEKGAVVDPLPTSQRSNSMGRLSGMAPPTRRQGTMRSGQDVNWDRRHYAVPKEKLEGGGGGGGARELRGYDYRMEENLRSDNTLPSGNLSLPSHQDCRFDSVGYSSLEEDMSYMAALQAPPPLPSYPPPSQHHHHHAHQLDNLSLSGPQPSHTSSHPSYAHYHQASTNPSTQGPRAAAQPMQHFASGSSGHQLLEGRQGERFRSYDSLPSEGRHQVGHPPILLPPSMAAEVPPLGRNPAVTSSQLPQHAQEHATRQQSQNNPQSERLSAEHLQAAYHSSSSLSSSFYSSQRAPRQNPAPAAGAYPLHDYSGYLPPAPFRESHFVPSLSTLNSQEPSLEWESESPQGQSSFPEEEIRSLEQQPLSLQVGGETSRSLSDSRESSSAPSSLHSPSHNTTGGQQQKPHPPLPAQLEQQRKRPDQLLLVDQLARQTQRLLKLNNKGKESGSAELGKAGSSGSGSGSGSGVAMSSSIEILEQPRDATVKLHQKAVFTCKALLLCWDRGRKVVEVDEEPRLQWYKEREPLSNEVMKDLIVSDVKEEDAGCYHCVVTHPRLLNLSVSSGTAQLTVKTSSKSVGVAIMCDR